MNVKRIKGCGMFRPGRISPTTHVEHADERALGGAPTSFSSALGRKFVMAFRSCALLALGVLLCAGAQASDEPKAGELRTGEAVWKADADLEIKGLITVARNAAERKAWVEAEAAYQKLLTLGVANAAKRDALLEMGAMFEKSKAYAKAAMVYEGFLDRFRDDPAAADVSIRLGRACRELGAFQTALAKFYNALHSSLRVKGPDAEAAQRQLALKAQFEIAETHFAKGDYTEAKRFFVRLLALDMGEDDRELVEFRLASTVSLLGDPGEAAALARKFLTEHPQSARTSETYYLLAQALQKLGRNDEAAKETMKLLKEEKPREKEAPETWRRWKMRTGMELAGSLYGKGDALNALTIYQRLAELDTRPEWRWPIVYQIGLCFERLRLAPRALEAYAYLTSGELPKSAGDSPMADLPAIREMAQWKMDYLRWSMGTDQTLSKVLKPDWKSAAIQPLKFRETAPSDVGATGGGE
jgi:tetratricopeptide (TPR) repeat protein